MSLNNEQWNDICDAIRKNECVLLLGPNAAVYDGEPLQNLLAEKFAQILQRKYGLSAQQCPQKLFELIKLYHNEHKTPTDALESIGKIMTEFYTQFSPADITAYQLVADLPLPYIINTAPDNLVAQALTQNDRIPLYYSFHFADPEHNATANKKAINLDQEIDLDRPLLYNLMGHYDLPHSLVLTDDDRLKFIETILQTDKGGLPPNLAYYFTNKPRFRMRKIYLFIGFDFNDWHLRLLMHLLRRSQEHRPQTFSLQAPQSLSPDVHFFYDQTFNMVFIDQQSNLFLSELKNRLEKPIAPHNNAALKLLLLYHEADTPLREELEKYLAPLRNSGLVELWHEGKLLAGSNIDQTIAEQLQTADVIVPLITANFMASDKLYDQHLQIALQRHKNNTAKLVPILMTPYNLDDTVFYDLNTLLPKPRGKAISQKSDREEALAKVATELRRIIEQFKNPTQISLL